MELRDVYNNEEMIVEYVTDLEKLHEVMNMRHDAFYKFNIRLKQFKLMNGLLWMDICGNTMMRCAKDTDSYQSGRIPKHTSICPQCGKGWNLHNLQDYFTRRSEDNTDLVFYHLECHAMNNLESKKKEFIDIFSKVYDISLLSFKPIPNEYCPDYPGYAPWFIVSTPDGDIKIGWRKRVINIAWEESYKPFLENFLTEITTKGFGGFMDCGEKRFIHAWGIESCIDYLQRAKNSIINHTEPTDHFIAAMSDRRSLIINKINGGNI